MKTWDMLEILAKYPEKKFNNKTLGQVELYEGTLVWSSNMEEVIMSNTVLKMEWEEVKEPVDFMEALKSCKRVSVEHPNLFDMPAIYKKNASIATVINYIFESYSDALVREIILNGKWYIED